MSALPKKRGRRQRLWRSRAEQMALNTREDAGLFLDFTDETFQGNAGLWGSAFVKDNSTAANNFHGAPYNLLTYTSPSAKMCLGPSGTLRFGPHNLLLRSQEFDNAAWTKTDTTVTANNTTAPDGTLTAELMTQGSAGTAIVSQTATSIASATYAGYLYMKAGTATWIRFSVDDGANGCNFWVNISTGASGTLSNAGTGTAVTSSVISVGDGWYRISASSINGGTTQGIRFAAVTGDNTGTRASSVTYYVWGAQLTRTPADTTYLSTTSAARYGLPYEWSTAGVLQGLLVEEARTNVITGTAAIVTDSGWAVENVTKTAVSVTSPAGEATTPKIVESSGSASRRVYRLNASLSTSTTYAFSVRLKADGRRYCHIRIELTTGATANYGACIDLNTGTITTGYYDGTTASTAFTTSSATLVNGYYYFVATFSSGSSTIANTFFHPSDSTTTTTYTGDGSSGILIWQPQLEAGSFPTSPIPTYAGATATRAADQISLATSAFPLSATAGTLYAEGYSDFTAVSTGGSSPTIASISDGSTNNWSALIRTNSTNAAAFAVNTSNVSQASISNGTWSNSTIGKIAGAWASNDFQQSFAGTLGTQDTSGSVPVSPTTVRIGDRYATGVGNYTGYVRKLMYLPRRMASADLQALTT